MFTFTFPDQDHYEAEFLYRNPNSCYWQTITLPDGQQCVVDVPVPSIPAGAIALPTGNGGNNTAAVESVINAAPNRTYVGSGTYGLDDLQINQPGTVIYNMPSVPTGSTGRFISINADDVRLIDCPQDAQNQGSVFLGIRIVGAHRPHLIRSGLSNMLHNAGQNGGGVFIRDCHDFHFACNTYKNLLNPINGTNTCRANAFWMNGFGGHITDGGYIVNNVAENLHSTGNPPNGDDDAEFLTVQSHAGHAKQIKVFANRCVDAGKRLIKSQQDGGITALSNFYHWDTNTTALGNRTRLSVVDVLLNTSDVIARNNRIKIDGNRNWGYAFSIFSTNGSSATNIHFDHNCIEINNPWNGAAFDQRIFSCWDANGAPGTSSGSEPSNSTIQNNIVYGAGAVNWNYWMGNGYDLNSGSQITSGNIINLPAPSPIQGNELQNG